MLSCFCSRDRWNSTEGQTAATQNAAVFAKLLGRRKKKKKSLFRITQNYSPSGGVVMQRAYSVGCIWGEVRASGREHREALGWAIISHLVGAIPRQALPET